MSTILLDEVSEESGVPVADLTTVSRMFPELVGPAYSEMVTLAPHVVRRTASWDAWYSYTWREYMESQRGKVEPCTWAR